MKAPKGMDPRLPIGRIPGPRTRGSAEDILQSWIMERSAANGWRRWHPRKMTGQHGRTMTPIQGDIGWPDVTMVHAERGLFVVRELKSDIGVVTPEQKAWIADLCAAGVDASVWRCRDWPEALALISFGRETPPPGWDYITAKKWKNR